jgi:mxaD protein
MSRFWSKVLNILAPLVLLLTLSGVQYCLAHGAAPKKLEENIQIAAPPEKVWNIIKDFAGISSWNPKIKSSEAKKDSEQGTLRILKLESGGQVTDALTDYEADKMTYSYRRADADVKALPASFYTATITVAPGKGGGSEVSWIGRYYRGDTSNEPPPELTDEAAAKALGELFQAGLKNLKTLAEKK